MISQSDSDRFTISNGVRYIFLGEMMGCTLMPFRWNSVRCRYKRQHAIFHASTKNHCLLICKGRRILSFFVNNKFGIFTTFIISTDQNKIHIRQNAKAPLTAELAFELVSKIGRVVIKVEYNGAVIRFKTNSFDVMNASQILLYLQAGMGMMLLCIIPVF